MSAAIPPSPARAALIRAIQTARRTAGLADEDTWRDWLRRAGGGDSLRAMDERRLKAVLSALNTLTGRGTGRGAAARYAPSAGLSKARALWLALAEAGVVRDRSEAAFGAFIRRQTGQDVGALSAASAAKVIEALKAMARRHGVETGHA